MSVPVTVKAQLADISARVSTVGMARAAIGHATTVLAGGYARLGDVTGLAGLDDAARSLLDQCRAYADKIYTGLPSDVPAQAFDLSTKQRLQVAEVVRECSEATAAVNDAAGLELSWDDFVAGFVSVVEVAGSVAGKALDLGGRGVFVLLWAFVRSAWWVLLIVALAIFFLRRRLANLARLASPGVP